jgi:Protein of unknown function (DUF1592)/Protein of unknown function (DUF1588)/Protein of unknown function (DUF1587)/Protein of unknown function (DUF1585)/Protein of unknown function (DUF1595)/Planctomycete cytochrome C
MAFLSSVRRWMCLSTVVIILVWTDAAQAQDLKEARAVITRQCLACHGVDADKGALRLDLLSSDLSQPDVYRHWLRAFDRVEKGEMPPKNFGKLPEADRKLFLSALKSPLIQAESARPAASVRRMNRVEYETTLRDLLALPGLRVKESLPEDGRQDGFDKVAGALDISPIHMAKYLKAADFALRQAVAVPSEVVPSKVWREAAAKQHSAQLAIATHAGVPINGRSLAPGLKTHIAGNPKDDIGNSYLRASFDGNAESVGLLTGVGAGGHLQDGLQIDRWNPPMAGWYKVRFSLWGLRWSRTQAEPAIRNDIRRFNVSKAPYTLDAATKEWVATPMPETVESVGRENDKFYGNSEAIHVVRASVKGTTIGYFDALSLQPKTHEFQVWLNPGERISFHSMTLPTYAASNYTTQDGVRTYEGPSIAYDWFEVEGPIVNSWPAESRSQLFGKKPPAQWNDKPKAGAFTPLGPDVVALLTNFADRAFRRPVTPAEMQPYIKLVEEQWVRSPSLEVALLAGYQAMLCSPDFLLIGLEDDGHEKPGKVTHGLASRLSYLVWNSMPDATLRTLAANGTLQEPAVLKAQLERLLADPRSQRFIEHFLDEWLDMKKLDFTTPDPQLYPEFDPWLRDSMLAETQQTFRRMLVENRSVRELIRADSILVNQRLAEQYGIRGVNGAEFRPVKVDKAMQRGGFLTHASVLRVTANGTSTSPVLRGVWIAERILGIPRNPPPPNIPAVEPDATGAVTIRQMIEKHRADPNCASCHAHMDPYGLALEHYDVIGGWRERYRLSGPPKKIPQGQEMVEEPSVEIQGITRTFRTKIRLGSKVDPTGELDDGRKFDDVAGLQTLLLQDDDQLARNLLRQLTIYATGAGPRFADRERVEAAINRTRTGQHGIRSLLHEVVQSEAFRRTGPRTP